MPDTKKVHLFSTRPRVDKIVEITPTDTATNVLNLAELNPNDYHLIKPADQDFFEMDEAVYPHVADGGKLSVVPRSNVGGGVSPRFLSTYSQDQGWTSCRSWDGTTVYTGYFRIPQLRWEGRVIETLWGALQFEINNPPIARLRQTEWGGCFHALQGTWMWITFKKLPTDADSGIAAINSMLKHVYEYQPLVFKRLLQW